MRSINKQQKEEKNVLRSPLRFHSGPRLLDRSERRRRRHVLLIILITIHLLLTDFHQYFRYFFHVKFGVTCSQTETIKYTDICLILCTPYAPYVQCGNSNRSSFTSLHCSNWKLIRCAVESDTRIITTFQWTKTKFDGKEKIDQHCASLLVTWPNVVSPFPPFKISADIEHDLRICIDQLVSNVLARAFAPSSNYRKNLFSRRWNCMPLCSRLLFHCWKIDCQINKKDQKHN